MPTYEYECRECGMVLEVFQSITEKAKKKIPVECRQCDNQAPVRRLIGTGGAILFKGSGFYVTDYRSDSYKKAAQAESQKTVGGDGKAEGKNSSSGGGAAAGDGGSAKPTNG